MTYHLKTHPRSGICEVAWCRHRAVKGRRLCARHYKRKWRAEHPIHALWRMLIDNARRRKVAFQLTVKDFINFLENSTYLDKRGIWRTSLHLDRKDHTKGYVKGNIQTLTCSANSAKGNRERYVRKPERPF